MFVGHETLVAKTVDDLSKVAQLTDPSNQSQSVDFPDAGAQIRPLLLPDIHSKFLRSNIGDTGLTNIVPASNSDVVFRTNSVVTLSACATILGRDSLYWHQYYQE